eukprot:CAMPEP_0179920422 /NCGR_PEP_ID=MMETSP0983-20121128/4480_1 /TAXON_ID=483367 /ORGANISM="non described non described, Strain CCMP 2436" /LENGTH=73 /DNA_ID=CAMNT_0021823467 /DNA_START=284 /DNA_END=502 /DNA_ORIENTATION=-
MDQRATSRMQPDRHGARARQRAVHEHEPGRTADGRVAEHGVGVAPRQPLERARERVGEGADVACEQRGRGERA